jgi:hypothetical protein
MDALETTAVVERALAGEPPAGGDPLELELRELTLALAAETFDPDPDFVRQLDERVELGFAPDGGAARSTLARRRAAASLRKLSPSLARRRPSAALLGAVASALIALVVTISLTGDEPLERAGLPPAPTVQERSGDSGDADSELGGTASSPSRPPDDRDRAQALRPTLPPESIPGGELRAIPVPPPPGRSAPYRRGFSPGTRDRRIERSATLTLAAPDDKLDRVAAGIATVADRHRGFVLDGELVIGGDGATPGGSFGLRIPTDRLDAALADLAKLGEVRSRSTAGRDVTAAVVTTGDRLAAARAERTSLLTRLETADSDGEATSLRLQLEANAREVNRLKGRVASLRLRANYAKVAVTVVSADAAAAPDAGEGDGLGGALDDALDSLGAALELLIRALGVAIPLALVATAAGLAARAIRRRRREAALE